MELDVTEMYLVQLKSYQPGRHLRVQRQQWKHQNYVINLFKAVSKPKQCQWHRSDVFIVNFEQVLQIVLEFHCKFWRSTCDVANALNLANF